MQGAAGEPASQDRISVRETERERSIITLIILDIFYCLAEARERIRSLRTGHQRLHGGPLKVLVLFLLIPGFPSAVKAAFDPMHGVHGVRA